jgi:hypothetical protein
VRFDRLLALESHEKDDFENGGVGGGFGARERGGGRQAVGGRVLTFVNYGEDYSGNGD